jgi:hypothetical protein
MIQHSPTLTFLTHRSNLLQLKVPSSKCYNPKYKLAKLVFGIITFGTSNALVDFTECNVKFVINHGCNHNECFKCKS